MTGAPGVDLRPLRPDDEARLLAWRGSADARRYGAEPLLSPEAHARWFAALPDDSTRAYWIIEADGVPVGLAGVRDYDLQNRRSNWTFALAEPSARGRGVGTYVEYWGLEYAFEMLKLAKLGCEVLAQNEAALRLHQAFGFTLEARYRGHVLKESVRADLLALGLLAKEWRERRPAMAARLRANGFTPPVF